MASPSTTPSPISLSKSCGAPVTPGLPRKKRATATPNIKFSVLDTPSTFAATSTPPVKTYHAGRLSTTPIPVPSLFRKQVAAGRSLGVTPVMKKQTPVPVPVPSVGIGGMKKDGEKAEDKVVGSTSATVESTSTPTVQNDESKTDVNATSAPAETSSNKKKRTRSRRQSNRSNPNASILARGALPAKVTPIPVPGFLSTAAVPALSAQNTSKQPATTQIPLLTVRRSSTPIPAPILPRLQTLDQKRSTSPIPPPTILASMTMVTPGTKRKERHAETSSKESVTQPLLKKQKKLTNLNRVLKTPQTSATLAGKQSGSMTATPMSASSSQVYGFEASFVGLSKNQRKKLRKHLASQGADISMMDGSSFMEFSQIPASQSQSQFPLSSKVTATEPMNIDDVSETARRATEAEAIAAKALADAQKAAEVARAAKELAVIAAKSRADAEIKVIREAEVRAQQAAEAKEKKKVAAKAKAETKNMTEEKAAAEAKTAQEKATGKQMGAEAKKKAKNRERAKIKRAETIMKKKEAAEAEKKRAKEEAQVKAKAAENAEMAKKVAASQISEVPETQQEEEKAEGEDEDEDEDWDIEMPVFGSTQIQNDFDLSQAIKDGVVEVEESGSERKEEQENDVLEIKNSQEKSEEKQGLEDEDEEDDEDWDVDVPVFGSTQVEETVIDMTNAVEVESEAEGEADEPRDKIKESEEKNWNVDLLVFKPTRVDVAVLPSQEEIAQESKSSDSDATDDDSDDDIDAEKDDDTITQAMAPPAAPAAASTVSEDSDDENWGVDLPVFNSTQLDAPDLSQAGIFYSKAESVDVADADVEVVDRTARESSIELGDTNFIVSAPETSAVTEEIPPTPDVEMMQSEESDAQDAVDIPEAATPVTAKIIAPIGASSSSPSILHRLPPVEIGEISRLPEDALSSQTVIPPAAHAPSISDHEEEEDTDPELRVHVTPFVRKQKPRQSTFSFWPDLALSSSVYDVPDSPQNSDKNGTPVMKTPARKLASRDAIQSERWETGIVIQCSQLKGKVEKRILETQMEQAMPVKRSRVLEIVTPAPSSVTPATQTIDLQPVALEALPVPAKKRGWGQPRKPFTLDIPTNIVDDIEPTPEIILGDIVESEVDTSDDDDITLPPARSAPAVILGPPIKKSPAPVTTKKTATPRKVAKKLRGKALSKETIELSESESDGEWAVLQDIIPFSAPLSIQEVTGLRRVKRVVKPAADANNTSKDAMREMSVAALRSSASASTNMMPALTPAAPSVRTKRTGRNAGVILRDELEAISASKKGAALPTTLEVKERQPKSRPPSKVPRVLELDSFGLREHKPEDPDLPPFMPRVSPNDPLAQGDVRELISPGSKRATGVSLRVANKPVEKPNAKRTAWTEEEIMAIFDAIKDFCTRNDITALQMARLIHTPVLRSLVATDMQMEWLKAMWVDLLACLPSRKFYSIKLKVRTLIPCPIVRKMWTEADEETLKLLVMDFGQDWVMLGKKMEWEPVAVREHYQELVKRGFIDVDAWDDKQDRCLVNMVLGYIWHAWVHDNNQEATSLDIDRAGMEPTRDLKPIIDFPHITPLISQEIGISRPPGAVEARWAVLGITVTPLLLRKWAARAFESVGPRSFMPRVYIASLNLESHLEFIKAVRASGAQSTKTIPWMKLFLPYGRVRTFPENARMFLWHRYIQQQVPSIRMSATGVLTKCLIDYVTARGAVPKVDDDGTDFLEDEKFFAATGGSGLWTVENDWIEGVQREVEETVRREVEKSIVERWRQAPRGGTPEGVRAWGKRKRGG